MQTQDVRDGDRQSIRVNPLETSSNSNETNQQTKSTTTTVSEHNVLLQY